MLDNKPLARLWPFHETFGIVQVELCTAAGDYSRRTIHWPLFGRSGLAQSGELDLPAVAIWQALVHVERFLQERGARLQGGEQAEE